MIATELHLPVKNPRIHRESVSDLFLTSNRKRDNITEIYLGIRSLLENKVSRFCWTKLQ